jgi:nucleotide-binding universal stress UspA family protein
MSSMRTILVASDFSFDAHRAARRAALLAREHGATLRLLHVLHPDAAARAAQQRRRPPVDLDQRLSLDAHRSLDSLAEDVTAPDLTVEREMRSGVVLDEILAAADQADMLVLGPRGLRPIHELILGTAAERLLNKSRRPMLVVKREPAAQYRRVLVPVDFSDHSLTTVRFARLLVPNAELCLFHALESVAEGTLRTAGVSEENIAQYGTQDESEAREEMEKLIADLGPMSLPPLPVVQRGDPRVQISATAESYAADLIVIGKHGRSRLAEYFLGGATRVTLARALCDVAVVPEARAS